MRNKYLKKKLEKLNSNDFLDLIEEECKDRLTKRDKIKGKNDIDINKIYLLLTDQFWMRKIYIILHNGVYKGFKYNKKEAENEVETYNEFHKGNTYYGGSDIAYYKEEIVDIRDIY